MEKEREKENNVFNMFNPFVFGAAFWQNMMTNWWYNVGRDFFNDPIKMSKYWYDIYIDNLNELYPILNIFNNSNSEQKTRLK